MYDINQAILSLKPNSEFTMLDNDFATIQWLVIDGTAPTLKEIETELKKLNDGVAKAEADKVAAKQSAQAKLAALGLTADEVAAIVGN
jgi:hypothetical protein